MYSKSLLSIFGKKNISVMDRISIKSGKHTFEGILLPRAKEGNILVLKIDNGYNIGIKADEKSDVEIELISKQNINGGSRNNTNNGSNSGNHSNGIDNINYDNGGNINYGNDNTKFRSNHTNKKGNNNIIKKMNVVLLGCGGTISSKIDYKTEAVHPTTKADELIKMFPEINDIANVKAKNVLSILSENMNPEHWKTIANKVYDSIREWNEIKNNENIGGIVILHGTDTMHYSSAALSFMIKELPVPVIFVGAQRSSDRPSSDNKLNLINAIYSATQNVAEVGVCMHGESSDSFCYLHRGTRVRKMHTSRRDAFKSIDSLPLAKVNYYNGSGEQFEHIEKKYRKRKEGKDEIKKMKIDDKINSNVALVQTYPGIQPKFINSLSNYDGVVFSATGLGHIPTKPIEIIESLKSLIDSDIPVVAAPQTIYGRINLNVYSAGREIKDIGVIGNGADWTPETAFVKLCFVLGHEKKMSRIEDMMMKNIAGEITDRSTKIEQE